MRGRWISLLVVLAAVASGVAGRVTAQPVSWEGYFLQANDTSIWVVVGGTRYHVVALGVSDDDLAPIPASDGPVTTLGQLGLGGAGSMPASAPAPSAAVGACVGPGCTGGAQSAPVLVVVPTATATPIPPPPPTPIPPPPAPPPPTRTPSPVSVAAPPAPAAPSGRDQYLGYLRVVAPVYGDTTAAYKRVASGVQAMASSGTSDWVKLRSDGQALAAVAVMPSVVVPSVATETHAAFGEVFAGYRDMGNAVAYSADSVNKASQGGMTSGLQLIGQARTRIDAAETRLLHAIEGVCQGFGQTVEQCLKS